MSNVKYKTHNKIKNGRIVKVAESMKKHGADRKQEGLNNRGNYSPAANDSMIVPIWEKILLTVEEAAAYSNIGITKLYELINNPICNFVLHTGSRKRLIKRREFEKYLSHNIEI